MAQESFNYRAMLTKLDEKGPSFDYLAMLYNLSPGLFAALEKDRSAPTFLKWIAKKDQELAQPQSARNKRAISAMRQATVKDLIGRVELTDSNRVQRLYLQARRLQREQERVSVPLPGSAAHGSV